MPATATVSPADPPAAGPRDRGPRGGAAAAVAVLAAATLVVASARSPADLDGGPARPAVVDADSPAVAFAAGGKPGDAWLVVGSLEAADVETVVRVERGPLQLGPLAAVQPWTPPRFFVLSADRPGPPVGPADAPPPEHRGFLAPGASRDRLGSPLAGRLACYDGRSAVYVSEADGATAARTADAVLAALAELLGGALAGDLGPVADADGDGRLTVLVTSSVAALDPRRPVDACVRPQDFRADAPFGGDVIYLRPGVPKGSFLTTVLAHELVHAVAAGHLASAGRVEDDWLSEGLAHVGERVYGGDPTNLADRIAAFLAAPERSPLVVPDAAAAGLWRNPGHRGATYLFCDRLRRQGGPATLEQLLRSDRAGVANVEATTGVAFEELFRAWTVSLCDRPEGTALPAATAVGRGATAEVAVRGTAAAYFRLPALDPGERIRVERPPGRRLQITLVRPR